MQSTTIENLPNEILIKTFKNKSFNELSMLYGTNRRLRYIAIYISKIHKDKIGDELSDAIKTDNRYKVSLLLDIGIDVNNFILTYITPLTYAVSSEKKEIVRILLNRGADMNKHDFSNATPLSYATSVNNIDIMKMLLDAGADVNIRDFQNYYTPLMTAANNDSYTEVVELLLNRGADVNLKNQWGNTALIISILILNINNTKMLLKAGADVNIKNREGKDALFYINEKIKYNKSIMIIKRKHIIHIKCNLQLLKIYLMKY